MVMDSLILSNVDELTPQWLTACLGRTLALNGNYAREIEVVRTRKTTISSAYFLQVRYAVPTAQLPSRLFLKLPVSGQSLDREEIEFYRVLVPAMAGAFSGRTSPFLRCFDAAYAAHPERSHLLLEDLSLTHFTNEAQTMPAPAQRQAVMEAYARFHAFWWEHDWLGTQVGHYLTDAAIDGFIQTAQAKLATLRQIAGDELPAYQSVILAAVARAWPTRRRTRVVAGQGVTIVHRDPHPLNFLYPNEPTVDSVKLIDWQSWRIDTATDDLAYLMACHWPLTEQPELEQTLLAHYWQSLDAAGVQGYGWDDLLYDYRASIIRCLFFLLIAWSPTKWAGGSWQRRVRLGMEAFERWECGALLT